MRRVAVGVRKRRWLSWLLSSLVITFLLFSGFVIWAKAEFGAVAGAISYMRGERLIVHPSVIEVDKGESGESLEFRITMSNRTGRDVHLIGGKSTCGCKLSEDFPLLLSNGESREFLLKVNIGLTACSLKHLMTFYTDCEEKPLILIMGMKESSIDGGCSVD